MADKYQLPFKGQMAEYWLEAEAKIPTLTNFPMNLIGSPVQEAAGASLASSLVGIWFALP